MLYVFLAIVALLAVAAFLAWWTMIAMPGSSYRGNLAELGGEAATLRDELQRHVQKLAGEIGERNLHTYPKLQEARDYIEAELAADGYDISRQTYREVRTGLESDNLEVEIAGARNADEIVLVGAHYDSVIGSPGANDNASGCAAVLALARRFAGRECGRTLRFVLFVNEEPPYFQTPDMGSRVYARRCRERDENLAGVISVETIGYFTSERGSQQYPRPFDLFYPSEGDFIAVVGNVGSRRLVRQVVDAFRRHAQFPSEGGAVPGEITGVGWSDHWSFWQEGYQAVMITDTAPFRYPYYHTPDDTPEKLDYDRMARVVDGLAAVIAELADAEKK